MMVVKVYMWPGGEQEQEYLLAQSTFVCLGEARRDCPARGILEGERAYDVAVLKGPRFGGPEDGADVRPSAIAPRQVWREGRVRGHHPRGPGRHSRGEWDLIGGALKVLLGRRIRTYVGIEPPEQA